MKTKHVSQLVAAAMMACCASAQAAFAVEDGSAVKLSRPGEAHQQGSAGLSQVGVPTGPQPAAHGMAREVSLLTALKQIVPRDQIVPSGQIVSSGWRAKRAGGLDLNQMVSWRGAGKSWVDVLQQLAVANNFSVMIDWNTREVTVAPALFVPTGDGLRPSTTVSAAPVGPVSRTWEMVSTLTLRENIEAWASAAGWSVSWAAADYPPPPGLSLSGAFEDEVAGPFSELFKAYSKAKQPLTFTLYTKNKVLRVENSTYRQENVRDQLPNNRAMQ